MKRSTLLEKQIKSKLREFFEPLGSTRYFVEVKPRGHEFSAKIWVEAEILDEIAKNPEKLTYISDTIREVEKEFKTIIFGRLKPLL
ncbi:hypothetical protein V7O66_02700 [Methanolobus sp. ZRKC3]|uniref:hypothetical protein n=1 Tax=Methanolobus sp. ZRKC3 TaxID=3125786 RepID=UPI003253BCC3